MMSASSSASNTGKKNASQQEEDERNVRTLRELANCVPPNRNCFDCGQRGPTYVNVTVGSFVCTSCSGILRGLNPPHRIKSITMASFTAEEMKQIKSKGNEYCKQVWLGKYDSPQSLESEYQNIQNIKEFMIRKYEDKKYYVDPEVAIKKPKARAPAVPVNPVHTSRSQMTLMETKTPDQITEKPTWPTQDFPGGERCSIDDNLFSDVKVDPFHQSSVQGGVKRSEFDQPGLESSCLYCGKPFGNSWNKSEKDILLYVADILKKNRELIFKDTKEAAELKSLLGNIVGKITSSELDKDEDEIDEETRTISTSSKKKRKLSGTEVEEKDRKKLKLLSENSRKPHDAEESSKKKKKKKFPSELRHISSVGSTSAPVSATGGSQYRLVRKRHGSTLEIAGGTSISDEETDILVILLDTNCIVKPSYHQTVFHLLEKSKKEGLCIKVIFPNMVIDEIQLKKDFKVEQDQVAKKMKRALSHIPSSFIMECLKRPECYIQTKSMVEIEEAEWPRRSITCDEEIVRSAVQQGRICINHPNPIRVVLITSDVICQLMGFGHDVMAYDYPGLATLLEDESKSLEDILLRKVQMPFRGSLDVDNIYKEATNLYVKEFFDELRNIIHGMGSWEKVQSIEFYEDALRRSQIQSELHTILLCLKLNHFQLKKIIMEKEQVVLQHRKKRCENEAALLDLQYDELQSLLSQDLFPHRVIRTLKLVNSIEADFIHTLLCVDEEIIVDPPFLEYPPRDILTNPGSFDFPSYRDPEPDFIPQYDVRFSDLKNVFAASRAT